MICSEALSALRGRLRLNSHGLGAAQGKTSQLVSDEACAAADAAYLKLAALNLPCCSVHISA